MKKNYLNFYKNKKVLVTGHTGFKGSWLTLWLILLGAKVLGISRDVPTKPSLFKSARLKSKIKSVRGDIINYDFLNKKINEFEPDIVFHLAAQAIVKESYLSPLNTWRSNLIGTLNILDVLKNYKGKKIVSVFITSDKVYKNLETYKGYKEDDKLGGSDPYSASKASADIAISSYINSFLIKNQKILISTARAGNVIGGGDWSPGRLIPDCVKSWSKRRNVLVRNFKSTRPWQHVLEVLNGYLGLAYNLSKNQKLSGEAFNFGPQLSDKKKVIDVLNEAKLNWSSAKWKKYTNKKIIFKESKLLHLNVNKVKTKLNWKNYLTFKETIKLTIKWYINFYEKNENIFNFSLQQIKDYQKKIIKN
tara:strand:+ start:79 stop:1164 length:1086 start_codon:yes stop_codon:yes gene_type:complete